MTPLHRALTRTTLLTLLLAPALAQSPAPAAAQAAPTFDLADVHVSAHTLTPNFTGGALRGDRYILHNATMVNMISLAYGVDSDYILSGPAWLDTDRFDVSAHAPRGTSPDDVNLMLQSLLAERFHLVLRKDTHPIATYVLRVDKGGPSPALKSADEGEAPPLTSITPPPIFLPAFRATIPSPATTRPWRGSATPSATTPASTTSTTSSTPPASRRATTSICTGPPSPHPTASPSSKP